jgi:hypothetical protein
MSESAHATAKYPVRGEISTAKVIVTKIIVLTVFSLVLGFWHSWASTRFYKPEYVAGFHTGLMEGAIMPAALPGLLMGKDLPIYAANNLGRPYKIGFILGLNTCGTLYFGIAFWHPRRKRQAGSLVK